MKSTYQCFNFTAPVKDVEISAATEDSATAPTHLEQSYVEVQQDYTVAFQVHMF